jgi:hypothetical protein
MLYYLIYRAHSQYKLQTLDLFWSAISDDKERFNWDKLKILLKAIKKADFPDLENIHVCEDEFSEEDLDDLLGEIDVDYTAISDNKKPDLCS